MECIYDDLAHIILVKIKTTITWVTVVKIQPSKVPKVRMDTNYEFTLKYVYFGSLYGTDFPLKGLSCLGTH